MNTLYHAEAKISQEQTITNLQTTKIFLLNTSLKEFRLGPIDTLKSRALLSGCRFIVIDVVRVTPDYLA